MTGLARPESARWDPEQRVWFVSNINGRERPRDGDGFISRLAPDGRVEALRFVDGAAKGVTLHDPKGLAITGDTLWVADAGAVRGFNRRTGAPVATIDLDPVGALFPNDLAATPDGTLWLTDTGVRFDSAGNRIHSGPDRIYRIRGRRVSVALESGALGQPNGITWDPRGSGSCSDRWWETARCRNGRRGRARRRRWRAGSGATTGSRCSPTDGRWCRRGTTRR